MGGDARDPKNQLGALDALIRALKEPARVPHEVAQGWALALVTNFVNRVFGSVWLGRELASF